MMQWMVLWFAAAILFLAIDMAWLLWLGRSLYVSEIGEILRQPPNLWAAAAFYLLYVTGMLVMVIWPAPLGSGMSTNRLGVGGAGGGGGFGAAHAASTRPHAVARRRERPCRSHRRLVVRHRLAFKERIECADDDFKSLVRHGLVDAVGDAVETKSSGVIQAR